MAAREISGSDSDEARDEDVLRVEHIGVTARGKPLLFCRGFSYIRDKTGTNGITYWKCSNAKEGCRGRLKTDGSYAILNNSGEHNHVPDPTAADVARARQDMRRRAARTTESTQQILTACSNSVSAAAAAQLPTTKTMRKDVQRARLRAGNVPPNPCSLAELDLPAAYRTTIDGDAFVLHDSGADDGDDRMILFSTHEFMSKLELCDHWFADGTFKTVPRLFAQLYTIHAVVDEQVIPMVFALLPSKTQTTYERMLDATIELYPDLSPETVMMDFEIAAINAFRSRFPNVRVRGCFFHLSQNVYKHVQSLGLQQRYTDNAEFALSVRKIPALAFAPPGDVIDLFELLEVSSPPEAEGLLQYFEKYYIGRIRDDGQRREPMFPKELWNVHSQVLSGRQRTTNNVEGWHRRFSSQLACHHPTVWKAIDALKAEQRQSALKMERVIAGEDQPARKRKYVLLDKRLLRLTETFEQRTPDDFLRGIAHNLRLAAS